MSATPIIRTDGERPPLPLPIQVLALRSDAALAERFAAGDERAFTVLHDRHRATVFAICLGVLGAPHDAEDAAQDAFARLSVVLRNGDPVREPRAWLARVARNAAIDVVRRGRGRALTRDGELPEVAVRSAADSDDAGDLRTLIDAMAQLPESQRSALLMRELAGLSYREIAGSLGVDEEAVRGLIARARVGLRGFRAASELPCAAARAALETEPSPRRLDRTVRRHVRSCDACRGYQSALRRDAESLRALMPAGVGSVGGGSAIAGTIAAVKGAAAGVGLGAGASQVGAACAVSVCAAGAVSTVVLTIPPARRIPAVHHRAVPIRDVRAARANGTASPAARGGTGEPASGSAHGFGMDRGPAERGSTTPHGSAGNASATGAAEGARSHHGGSGGSSTSGFGTATNAGGGSSGSEAGTGSTWQNGGSSHGGFPSSGSGQSSESGQPAASGDSAGSGPPSGSATNSESDRPSESSSPDTSSGSASSTDSGEPSGEPNASDAPQQNAPTAGTGSGGSFSGASAGVQAGGGASAGG